MVRCKERQDIHGVFEPMNANQTGFPERTMWRLPDASASGFFDWLDRMPSQRKRDDAVLLHRIHGIHAQSNATCLPPWAGLVGRAVVQDVWSGHAVGWCIGFICI
jgi:hypothetical protein